MTDRFRRKVRSQRGASLLLALLFLLICAMVGASILMAAASNAGKHRSNLTEHQTYLALSSAVSLLCDELNAAQYQGQYKYWTETVEVGNDEDGNPIMETRDYFEQVDGSYTYTGSAEEGKLKSILLENFDAIFAAMNEDSPSLAGFYERKFKPTTVSYSHNLELTPQTGIALLDGQDIKITLNVVQESYAMELTATLGDYSIQAEITPTETMPTIGALNNPDESVTKQTAPMKWKLGWITTGAEEGDEP